eukprot:TRINITY_DN94100_c0_g1_i1.p1 TRINITY_DN94100_c0_g1~~TRINITY_DN94100_c0_g1_i1.p1  ORF type:complete len:694 (+),score=113.98 TRINITY_DN94100_c0_g1_i1:174-2255(+)
MADSSASKFMGMAGKVKAARAKAESAGGDEGEEKKQKMKRQSIFSAGPSGADFSFSKSEMTEFVTNCLKRISDHQEQHLRTVESMLAKTLQRMNSTVAAIEEMQKAEVADKGKSTPAASAESDQFLVPAAPDALSEAKSVDLLKASNGQGSLPVPPATRPVQLEVALPFQPEIQEQEESHGQNGNGKASQDEDRCHEICSIDSNQASKNGDAQGQQQEEEQREASEDGTEESEESRNPMNPMHQFSMKARHSKCGRAYAEGLHELPLIQQWAISLSQDRRFELATAGIIMANAMVIGWNTDWAVQNPGVETPLHFLVIDASFTAIFSLELLLRIVAEASFFLSIRNNNIHWNLFDSFVVASALTEELFNTLLTQLPDIRAMRIIRLLRVVRILRVIRVMRFFRDLRIMVAGIASSMKALFWCILLLLMLMFSVSVVFLQVIAESIASDVRTKSASGDHSLLKFHFGSLWRSIYTLYLTITGGLNWGEAAEPLLNLHPLMAILFSIYIGFAVMCVLNIVTCVFVDKANQFTKSDMDNLIMEEVSSREQWLKDMRGIFQTDDDGYEELNAFEFQSQIDDPRVQAYFRKIGLNIEKDNAIALFKLIDLDDSGTVGLEEFVEGCSQFVGGARQLDIARLKHDTARLSNTMKEYMQLTLDHFAYLENDKRGLPPSITTNCLPKKQLGRRLSKFEFPGY